MGVTGDMNGLRDLANKIRQLTSSGFKTEVSKALGATAWAQTLEGFRDSRDPYGQPWKPLKLRAGKPLIDTGQMRQSVSMEPTSNGFRLRIGVKHAKTHQYGAEITPKRARMLSWKTASKRYFAKRVRIPRRQMFPERSTGGLGPIWTAAFNKTASGLLRRHLGKAA